MSSETIDTAALAKLKDMIGGGTEDLTELVDDFVSSFPEQVTLMRGQVTDQDWSALRIVSHSCKSNARDLGAHTLSELCATLELQCKNGAPTDPDGQLSSIEAASTAAIAALGQLNLADV